MNKTQALSHKSSIIKWLTYLMFMMFAMTTDAVGEIIPEVMRQFNLNMTAAGLLHYCPMTAIALAGILLGFLADIFGRKRTIILGLALFAVNSYLFLIGSSFSFFLILLIVSGFAIGIFKTAALALIGDISKSAKEHTATMNAVEGFFGVGAIIGPFLVSFFLARHVEWKWLYIVAATLCLVLIFVSLIVRYPKTAKITEEPINIKKTLKMARDPYALGFSIGAFLYVSVETAIYVWMPSLLVNYKGNLVFIATYALSIFFILRAGGRFIGVWLMSRFNWSIILAISSILILLCYLGSFLGGEFTVILLPLSGLFMSVIYPTINSKGISCFPKANHGAVAGIILFFTAAGAALGPLSMGAISDLFNSDARYGFVLATLFAALLFAGTIFNLAFSPTKKRLASLNKSEY
jgi:MFS transporter, FHS family, L-fucose permease